MAPRRVSEDVNGDIQMADNSIELLPNGCQDSRFHKTITLVLRISATDLWCQRTCSIERTRAKVTDVFGLSLCLGL